MKLLLDMDGVVVDFVTGYFSMIGKKYDRWKPGVWDIQEATGHEMDENLLTTEFWANLPWMQDGPIILKTLEREFGSENICILSSCHVRRVGDACAGKIKWILKHMNSYHERYLFGPNKSFCSHRDSVLVDDRDENVNKFRAEGGRAILIPRIWNSAHPRVGQGFDLQYYLLGQIDAVRSQKTT